MDNLIDLAPTTTTSTAVTTAPAVVAAPAAVSVPATKPVAQVVKKVDVCC